MTSLDGLCVKINSEMELRGCLSIEIPESNMCFEVIVLFNDPRRHVVARIEGGRKTRSEVGLLMEAHGLAKLVGSLQRTRLNAGPNAESMG